MTPDERDRLLRVELVVADQKDDLIEIKAALARLEAIAHMGRGAWLLLLKIGGVLTAIVAAAAWVVDKFHK